MDDKLCPKCDMAKPATMFYKNVRSRDGLAAHCKECLNETTRLWRKNNPGYRSKWSKNPEVSAAWYQRNKEHRAEYLRKWASNNRVNRNVSEARRRGLKKDAGDFSLEEWVELCDTYGNVCLACGRDEPLTIDHVVPLSVGGSNTIDNLQPLCKSCNCKKSTKTIDYREKVN